MFESAVSGTLTLSGAFLQTVHIADGPNGIQVITRKKSASHHTVRKAAVSSTIRNRSGPRRAAGVTAQIAKRGYRPDLRTVSVVVFHSFRCALSCTTNWHMLVRKEHIIIRTI